MCLSATEAYIKASTAIVEIRNPQSVQLLSVARIRNSRQNEMPGGAYSVSRIVDYAVEKGTKILAHYCFF